MQYYTNHCWCYKSNWDNDFFDCQHLVTLDAEIDEEFNDILQDVITEKEEPLFKKEVLKILNESIQNLPEGVEERTYIREERTRRLSEQVFMWLLENVEDCKEEKGWCVGSDEYNSNDYYQEKFTIFFKRRKDAFNFVKTWSKYKKFTQQINYFKDTRKDLDFETMKYIHSER